MIKYKIPFYRGLTDLLVSGLQQSDSVFLQIILH